MEAGQVGGRLANYTGTGSYQRSPRAEDVDGDLLPLQASIQRLSLSIPTPVATSAM